MIIPAAHELHSSPLQFFEHNFSSLIDQSKNITIQYCFSKARVKKKDFDRINIVSVNGCATPEEYGKWLTTIIEPSMDNLFKMLKGVHQTYWEPHLDYISDKMEQLTFITTDERFVFQDDDFCLIREHHFKSFNNCRLCGPGQEELNIFGHYIRFKAVRFAEVWIDVIYSAIDRLDLIHKLLLKSIAVSSPLQDDKSTTNKSDYKIKSDLTVSHMGFLFRLLVKSGLIIVPGRQNMNLINWITNNFQSKNQESIRLTSLRNKYFTPDLQALDFWEQKIKDWQTMIQNERDNLLQ